MLAITCKDSILTLAETSTPTPSSFQLLVKVKATAVNRADLLQRRGKYPPPPGESDILGLEIAGEVVAVGKEVSRFQVGDRVFGLVGGGGYAEYCLIDHEVAMPIPESLSFVEAAAIPEAFLTAYEAIFTLGCLQPQETILIHAGASGIGTAAIQLAHHTGATIFTTVGSEKKRVSALNWGADIAINYNDTDFAVAIANATQHKGVNVIVDLIGGNYLLSNLQSLQSNGRLICVGLMGGSKAEINLDLVLKKRLQIKGLIMRNRPLEDKRSITQCFSQYGLSLLAERKIQPVIDSVYPLSDALEAHKKMEANANIGKIILQI